MATLRDLDAEVMGQPRILAKFSSARIPRAPRGSLFVGAGDSYAAALAGFHASKAAFLALDPYSLVAFPEMAKGREVFFVSASGRTSANVAAAGKVRGFAKKTTAITADLDSRLATLTDGAIGLPMILRPRTPGFLSFSLSLLAVLKVSAVDVSCDFEGALRKADVDCGQVSLARGTSYFLGNSAAYAVSAYAAGKVYEMLGSKSHAELLEEFSHLELFSLRKEDSVNAFGCFDPSGIGNRLLEALARQGYESRQIPSRGSSTAERVFHSVFAVQLATIRAAEAAGMSEPRFASEADKLEMSDAMIY